MKSKQWLAWLLLSYVESVLACMVTPLELLRRPFLTGPAILRTTTGAKQFAGLTAIASGTASVTVSTAVVNSDSIIFHALQGATIASSGGVQPAIIVNSVVSGVSFAFASIDGVGREGGTIMWEIKRTS